MKIAKIIIVEQPIPCLSNGSWTQRLEYFLKSESNVVDYLICGETKAIINTSSKIIGVKQNKNRVVEKLTDRYRYKEYISSLKTIMKDYDHSIILVIDNLKLKKTVSAFVDKDVDKNKITLMFYNCGFSYFLNSKEHKYFSKNLDEIIFLTQAAYNFNKQRYNEFIPEVTVLHNPIQKNKFFKITLQEKRNLLEEYNLGDKKVYLWLSHDREKKGLTIVLNAWKTWSKTKNNVVLLVVGASRDKEVANVRFIGVVPNNKVHVYYKLADVFLFSPLWKEGFGLSLAQAICSGCFCIVANNGGVADYFTLNDGILEEEPNRVSHWIENIELSYNKINSGWSNETAGKQILDIEQWSDRFAQVFNKWEERIKL
ncbi:MAG: glycosyltransferase family 4 protein [Algibacter sp.]